MKQILNFKSKKMSFLNTFRARLLIILIILLITTLSFQYFLNLKTQEENNRLREKQEQALVAATALGTRGITSTDYLSDLVKSEEQTVFDEKINERIQDIIIINQNWQITDSLNNEELIPVSGENGETVYKNLADVKNLPPLQEAKRLGEDAGKFPNAAADATSDSSGEAHAIAVNTSKGRWYVMDSEKRQERARAPRRAAFALHARHPFAFDLYHDPARLAFHAPDRRSLERRAAGRRRESVRAGR